MRLSPPYPFPFGRNAHENCFLRRDRWPTLANNANIPIDTSASGGTVRLEEHDRVEVASRISYPALFLAYNTGQIPIFPRRGSNHPSDDDPHKQNDPKNCNPQQPSNHADSLVSINTSCNKQT